MSTNNLKSSLSFLPLKDNPKWFNVRIPSPTFNEVSIFFKYLYLGKTPNTTSSSNLKFGSLTLSFIMPLSRSNQVFGVVGITEVSSCGIKS